MYLRATEFDVLYSRQFLSVTLPIYDLAKLLQSKDIGLAGSVIQCLQTFGTLSSDSFPRCDVHGYVKTADGSFEIVMRSDIQISLLEFVDKFLIEFEQGILEFVDDQALVGIILCPKYYTILENWVTTRIGTKMGGICSRLMSRLLDAENKIIQKMLIVENSKQEINIEKVASDVVLPPTKKLYFSSLSMEDYLAQTLEPTSAQDRVLAQVQYFKHLKALSPLQMDDEFFLEHRASLSLVFPVYVQNRGAPYSTGRLESMFSILKAAIPPQAESTTSENLNAIALVKNSDIKFDSVKLAKQRISERKNSGAEDEEDESDVE